MKRFKLWSGIIITLMAITWPFAAVWLHAYQFIGNITETYTCWYLCLPAAMFGPACYWSERKSEKLWRMLLTMLMAVLSAMFAMTIILASRVYSDRMFTHWVMQRIPASTWQQMVSDIERLVTEAKDISPKKLPESFSLLGRADECWAASIWNDEDGFFGAAAQYGDRNRCWGFLVGSEEYLQRWSKFRRIPVATNACFFIGGGW